MFLTVDAVIDFLFTESEAEHEGEEWSHGNQRARDHDHRDDRCVSIGSVAGG